MNMIIMKICIVCELVQSLLKHIYESTHLLNLFVYFILYLFIKFILLIKYNKRI